MLMHCRETKSWTKSVPPVSTSIHLLSYPPYTHWCHGDGDSYFQCAYVKGREYTLARSLVITHLGEINHLPFWTNLNCSCVRDAKRFFSNLSNLKQYTVTQYTNQLPQETARQTIQFFIMQNIMLIYLIVETRPHLYNTESAVR